MKPEESLNNNKDLSQEAAGVRKKQKISWIWKIEWNPEVVRVEVGEEGV